jgi:DNA ligase (NAD+)
MDGFGEKSYENMMKAVQKSRNVHPVNFIYALSIPMIGADAGKRIVGAIGYEGFLDRLDKGEGFEDIDGIGPEKSNSIIEWYRNPKNKAGLHALSAEVDVKKVEMKSGSEGKCAGLTFVITGDVHHFKNRDEFKAYVESQSGTVTSSVSNKTSYLVNNDIESTFFKKHEGQGELGISIHFPRMECYKNVRV